MAKTLLLIHTGTSGSLLLLVPCLLQHGHCRIHCGHLNAWNGAVSIEGSYSWIISSILAWVRIFVLTILIHGTHHSRTRQYYVLWPIQYASTGGIDLKNPPSWIQGTKKAEEEFGYPCSRSYVSTHGPWVIFLLFTCFVPRVSILAKMRLTCWNRCELPAKSKGTRVTVGGHPTSRKSCLPLNDLPVL